MWIEEIQTKFIRNRLRGTSFDATHVREGSQRET